MGAFPFRGSGWRDGGYVVLVCELNSLFVSTAASSVLEVMIPQDITFARPNTLIG